MIVVVIAICIVTVMFAASVRVASAKFQSMLSTDWSVSGLTTFAFLMSFGVVISHLIVANGLVVKGHQPNRFLF
jgi:hypothetical protein